VKEEEAATFNLQKWNYCSSQLKTKLTANKTQDTRALPHPQKRPRQGNLLANRPTANEKFISGKCEG